VVVVVVEVEWLLAGGGTLPPSLKRAKCSRGGAVFVFVCVCVCVCVPVCVCVRVCVRVDTSVHLYTHTHTHTHTHTQVHTHTHTHTHTREPAPPTLPANDPESSFVTTGGLGGDPVEELFYRDNRFWPLSAAWIPRKLKQTGMQERPRGGDL
jgi:hypothetical protein